MTITAKSAIAAGVMGAFWLGVWTGPVMQERNNAAPVEQTELLASESPAKRGAVRAERVSSAGEPVDAVTALAPSAEPVRKHVKPLLKWGADTEKAAEGFTSAEQFVAVAHAAKNTEVPFVLLKHRVLNEKQSLAEAIRISRPELDATLEADRAKLEARANLSRFGM